MRLIVRKLQYPPTPPLLNVYPSLTGQTQKPNGRTYLWLTGAEASNIMALDAYMSKYKICTTRSEVTSAYHSKPWSRRRCPWLHDKCLTWASCAVCWESCRSRYLWTLGKVDLPPPLRRSTSVWHTHLDLRHCLEWKRTESSVSTTAQNSCSFYEKIGKCIRLSTFSLTESNIF